MSLLPLPSRLPARKHVMAFVFGLVGLSLMMAAVLTASGLGSPFRARGPETVRTGAVLVNEPTTTTTALRAAPAAASESIRGLGPVPPGPATSAPRSTTPTTKPTATTTTTSPLPVAPPTTVPSLLGGLGRSLGGG